jgi:dihydrofolate synthase/folylpolyglutamate synthase
MVTADTLWDELQSRWPESQLEPSLSRIASVVELMGDPHRVVPVIQVAGTNGKSSTARMTESILRAYGVRTGLFTSPHLVRVAERICLDGVPVSDERLLAAWHEAEPYIRVVDAQSQADGGPRLSFFEVLTALAFAIFADAPVDVAVIEVGMGGTWDATNVVDAQVCIVTPIGLDHMEYLGDTIAAIAGEKAGIITADTEVVLAEQSREAADVLQARCAGFGISPQREGIEFAVTDRVVAVGGQMIGVRGTRGVYPELFLPLLGDHQSHNAACAIAGVESFLHQALDVDLVREGLAQVLIPGRLQMVRQGPAVIIDAAHNPHGAAALATALQQYYSFDSVIGVVGMLQGKDALGFLEILMPVVDELVITAPQSPRALSAADLAAVAESVSGVLPISVVASVPDAIDTAIGIAESRPGVSAVVIAGSVVLAGDAMRALDAAPWKGES